MFSIGIFSKINKITTKTLRYYDEIGLLKPDYIDYFTGYRYYTSQQLPKIHKIITLKQMGLSLNQIKEVINNPNEIEAYLESKEQDILKSIANEQAKLLQVRSYLNRMKGEDCFMYDVIIKALPEVKVAAMRQVIPSHQALFELCPNIMAKEMERLGCVCATPSYCFNIYHDGEYREFDIDVEICEAILELKEDTDILKFKIIKGIPIAVCVLHKGPYATLGEAYAYAFKWLEENNYEVMDNPRESYIDGIWNKESETEWLTEIQIPVSK
jgi:DNA-binding transcriptional MerR regulator